MKLYNRYIFYKTGLTFVAISMLLIALIWFSRTLSFAKYITENGVELKQFFFLLLLILPWLLLFIVPISLFSAILMTYNRLINNNEITVLKNAGLTKLAIGRPVMSLAVISTIFCFLVSLFLMPYANKKLRLERINFENNYSNLSFSSGSFEVLKSLTIYVKDKDEYNRLIGVLLHDERNKEYSMTITAQNGKLIMERGKLLLYMNDGAVQRMKNSTQESEILNFDDYVFNLSESNNGDVTQQMRWKAKERYLSELINPKDDSEIQDIMKYRAEIHQRFTYPLMPIILTIIALAAILYGNFNRRGNIFNIAFAIFFGFLFLGFTILCYRLIEANPMLVPLLYLNVAAFFILPIIALKTNFFS